MKLIQGIKKVSQKNGIARKLYGCCAALYRKARYSRIKLQAAEARSHYRKVIKKIRSTDSPTRFGAYVVFDSTFGGSGLFELMLKDPEKWQPRIVVIPDTSRGEHHKIETYKRTKEFFINKYGSGYVIDGYDMNTGRAIDVSDRFDIVYCANPYDEMVSDIHTIVYLSKQDLLPISISYGFDVSREVDGDRMVRPGANLFWKLFTDTTYSFSDIKKQQVIKGKNAVLVGYAKMDVLQNYEEPKNKTRKKILIAIHHTIVMKEFPLSNFLEYYDFIPQLPELFPDVDFVFRPHPLLFTAMINEGFWTQEQVDEYLRKLEEKHIEYSTGGDYLKLFAECDAMINDCGSFTVEWLYTRKPACFLYSSRLTDDKLADLMLEAIKSQYVAHSREDIMNFITKFINGTVENKIDETWLRENVLINYPDVSKAILREITLK